MNSTTYRFLGFAVWRGARWYVRQKYLRRLPSARKAAGLGLGALAGAGAVVILARRALG